ncbi:choline transporter-like protein 5-B isoform X2 [Brachyhypopomus gauderio]|uniref:choline transporter-like protein 5-B isoform X2 n=1 Tax=Brachyhypopomus gauderio TaxID=698409 RepID=UPI00404230E1
MARKSVTPPSYYGEPHRFDPTFRGPVSKRGCTDILCCVIFIIAILSYIALGTVAWIHGDMRKVIYPTDSYGQFCGQQGTPNADRSLLFHFNLFRCASPAVLMNLQCPTVQLCVSKCPDRFATYLDTQFNYSRNRSSWDYYRQFCRAGFNNPGKSVAQVLREEDCPSMLVPSRPLLHRCLPDFITTNGILTVANRTDFRDGQGGTTSVLHLKDAANGISSLLDAREMGRRVFEDYVNSWYWILIALVITMVISFLFIVLLRFTAGVLLWCVIFGVIAAVGYGIWLCYWEFDRLRREPEAEVTVSDVGWHTDVRVYLQLGQTWLAFMVLLVVVEVVMVTVLVFLRRRLHMAMTLLREGSRTIGSMMSTLFYPIVTFVMLAICIAYWAVTAIFLASSGDAVYKVVSTQPNCKHANSTCEPQTFSKSSIMAECPDSRCAFAFYGGESLLHRHLLLLHLWNLLLLLWLINFITALGQCTLAGAFASYYWALKKPADIPAFPLTASFARAIRYHTGSLAFGALLLSVVQFFRIILEYLDNKLKGAPNACARFLLCCLRCCFWCLEHFLRFMNRNAYIMIAIYGKSFCSSARDAFFLLMRNVVRVTVLDKVTDFLLFLGKLLISGSVGVLAFFFFTRKIPFIQEEVPKLHYYWVPLLTVIVGSYLVAHGFFSVYAMCVDTLFLCLCEDLERNDGSPSKPYFMSVSLHKILKRSDRPC